MNEFWIILIVVCGIAVSFLMSGMESGLFILNRLRLHNLERSGDYRARLLLEYLEKPEQFLWTILAGNILANFVVILMTAYYLNNVVGHSKIVFWLLFVLLIFVFYFLCDFLPKILFRIYGNSLCLSMLYPFRILNFVFSPAVWAITTVANLIIQWTGGKEYTGKIFASREEFRFFVRESGSNLTNEELMMIERVLDLKSIPIRHLTIPFDKVSTIDLHSSIPEALKLFKEKGFSHLPVTRTENNKITVAGIISLKDVLYREVEREDVKVAHFLKPALFLSDTTKLEEALTKLQKSGRKMAVVLGSDKREIGIISLNDILGFIFGDINL